jgi:hypothetical protein
MMLHDEDFGENYNAIVDSCNIGISGIHFIT